MNKLNGQHAVENAISSGMGCFMKGTLVETEEGWTPIDELKVGDLVMSRPENGIGKAVPKRVLNTFRYEEKEVWDLAFSTFPRREGGGQRLSATPDHPFCVYGVVTNLFMDSPFGVLGREDSIYYDNIDVENDEDWHEKFQALERFSQTPYEIALYETPVWKRVDQLERGDVVLAIGIDDNDQNYDEYRVVEMARPYFAVDSDNPNHAWVQGYTNKYGWERQSIGHIYDLTLDQANNYMYPRALAYDVENPAMLLGKDADGTLHYQPYRTTVYNIEVEDTHTYLVGHAGILVHNTCGQTRSDRMAEIQARSKDLINRDVVEILRRDDR